MNQALKPGADRPLLYAFVNDQINFSNISATIWCAAFFIQAITVRPSLLVRRWFRIWGVINLLEGYGNDNSKAVLMAGKHHKHKLCRITAASAMPEYEMKSPQIAATE